ncbi:MAG TPA: carboxypeptidase-like regulatory domain-containing protein [Terriglobia bacterium]|nr:carboxypeptidase-like regulatory domain-containing protein [Terriglobia bacterium]
MRAFYEKWMRLGIVVIGLLTGGLLYGQIISSTVVGQVNDSSGAVVPNATITVINQGTGMSVTSVTDSAGTYSVPNLQAGVYTVTATKTGFKTFRSTGINVLSAQSVRVDVRLQIGAAHQVVSVSGMAPLVNTESATVGGSITTRQISDLPFALQNIDGLMNLVPGAQISWGWSSPQTGGGTHWGSFNFTMNGVQANDPGNGAAAYSYGLGSVSLPAIGSFQEFKVDAVNTNAEYKQLGTVTMVTKAGTNQFHGEVYEYNQNKSLTANTFQNNALARPRSPFVRNQFGADVGGPIWRNKAFFFADYSGMRNRFYSQDSLVFPSMAMRQGDFSALCGAFDSSGVCTDPNGTQLYNPQTGQTFANNMIPGSMIAGQAKTLLTFLPPPDVTNTAGLPDGAPNYFGLVSTAQDVNSADLRVDFQLSDRDSLYGIYSRNVGDPWEWALGYPSTYGNASNFGYKTFNYTLVETHTFSPSMVNELRLAYFNHPGIRSGVNLGFDPRSLFPGLTASPNRGLPTMTISGYTGMFHDYGKGYYGQEPDLEYTDNFTYVKGKHTFKFGADETGYKNYGPNPNAPLGTFTFNGQWTGNKGWPGQPQSVGNAFADFLLGDVNQSTTGTAGVFEGVYSSREWDFYAQDTWQASPKITLYYGVRYQYQRPWKWQDGYSTYFDFNTNKLALPQNSNTPTLPPFGASSVLFNAYPFTTTQALGLPAFYMESDKNNWGPRFGIAWRPFGGTRTVFRGGYGVYYNFVPTFVGARDDVLNPPWEGGLGGFSGLNYDTQLPGNPTSPFLPDITFADPFPAALQVAGGAAPHPTIFSMQRDFKNAVVQQWNVTGEHQFASNWMTRVSYVGSQTHHLQWFFGDVNVPLKQTPNESIQNQRPLQPWANFDATRSGGKQNFDQLQVELNKRFSNGFMVQANYQWTRSLDNVDLVGGPQNWHFPNLDYGNTPYVRRHQIVLDYIYELPFGSGRQWLSGLHGVGQAVLGGWELSGITSYGTGLPFSVNFSVPSGYVGWWGGRADRVSGSSLYSGQQSGHDIFSGVQWFNTGAFAPPQPWTWGNSSRDSVFGPGFWDWDMSLLKNFKITERVGLQFRGDFLDAFNHFNLGNPGSTIADTRDGGTPVASAGKITTGSGNRVIQVGAKLTF